MKRGTRLCWLLLIWLWAGVASAQQPASRNPHGDLEFECSECHTAAGWSPLRSPLPFSHNDTGFQLRNAHGNLSCRDCHETLVFATEGASRECSSCHTTDFEQTTDPDHVRAGFPTACWGCHTDKDWTGTSTFDHSKTGFVLEGGHRNLDCLSCHQETYQGTASECASCHDADFRATSDPNHLEAGFETRCESCHTTQAWEPATFDHNQTAFALTGGHQGVDCVSCHTDGYSGTPTDCYACHETDFQSTSDPNHVNAGFDTTCESCHTTQAWEPATFDHNQTAFALTGGHRNLDCVSCHTEGYSGTPTDCYACHETDFRSTSDPNHVNAGFETTCESCHTTQAWEPATFDHSQTAFALTGGHQGVDCVSCHTDGYSGTPTDCYACHETDFRSTSDPNHVNAGIETTCESCHTTQAWKPATFDHNQTAFALTGGHRNLDCISCHTDGYSGTPTDCLACHDDDYRATTDPDHVDAGFATTCESCHTTQAWKPANFDHNNTSFPLTGQHQNVDCVSCHTDGYSGTPSDCFACHQTDYQQTTDPNHSTAGFATACASCHTTQAWEPANFDHNETSFPLTGQHQRVNCSECHTDGYTGTPVECFACHNEDYNNAQDPNHSSAGFPTECQSCHTTQAWEPADFDHNETRFPLTGAHRSVDCTDCHSDGYSGTPTDCFSCHQTDYQQTSDPNHTTAGFATSCESCHTTQAWEPANFDHDETDFPLTGAHRAADCTSCHTDGYTGTPTDCYACHQTEFNGTTAPDHADAGFPTSCQSCHSTQRWTPANFDHNQTGFPLVGEHRDVDCESCHASGYAGTPKDCFSCHIDDYNQTVDPNHSTVGFPTTCESCHNPSAWDDTSWDHDAQYFPIYSGKHREAWNTCEDCHTAPGNYRVFECILCHEHRKSEMDDDHSEVSGYRWESRSCLACHPDGDD